MFLRRFFLNSSLVCAKFFYLINISHPFLLSFWQFLLSFWQFFVKNSSIHNRITKFDKLHRYFKIPAQLLKIYQLSETVLSQIK